MAVAAIALFRIVEQRKAARFLLGQRHVAGEVGVVLAAVRIERAIILLINLKRLGGGGKGFVGIGKDVIAENLAQVASVASVAYPRRCVGRRAVCHLKGRQEWNTRLIATAVDAAIPGQATGWSVVDATVALVVGFVIMLGERRHDLQIFERRHRPQTRFSHVLAAELYRQSVGWAQGMRRIMTSGACIWPEADSEGSKNSPRPSVSSCVARA